MQCIQPAFTAFSVHSLHCNCIECIGCISCIRLQGVFPSFPIHLDSKDTDDCLMSIPSMVSSRQTSHIIGTMGAQQMQSPNKYFILHDIIDEFVIVDGILSCTVSFLYFTSDDHNNDNNNGWYFIVLLHFIDSICNDKMYSKISIANDAVIYIIDILPKISKNDDGCSFTNVLVIVETRIAVCQDNSFICIRDNRYNQFIVDIFLFSLSVVLCQYI